MAFKIYRESVFNNEFVAAARDGKLPEVRKFLDNGVDPDCPNVAGASAILQASEANHIDIVSLLLEHGACPDKLVDGRPRGQQQKTSLIVAATNGNLEVVKLLVSAGACMDLTDANGQTPLMWAVAYRQYEVARHLVSCGADISVVDRHGNTALGIAIETDNEDIATLLRQHI